MEPGSASSCAKQTPADISFLACEAPAFFHRLFFLRHPFPGIRPLSLARRRAWMVRAAGFRSRSLLEREPRHRCVRDKKMKRKESALKGEKQLGFWSQLPPGV